MYSPKPHLRYDPASGRWTSVIHPRPGDFRSGAGATPAAAYWDVMWRAKVAERIAAAKLAL